MADQQSRDNPDFENIRQRAHLYVGGLRNPDKLVLELIENAIDEAAFGPASESRASEIHVSLASYGRATVEDNGPGISIARDAEWSERLGRDVSILEHVVSQPWRGVNEKGDRPHCGGFRVGLGVVSALAEWFEVIVHREGASHRLRTKRGQVVEPLTQIEKPTRRAQESHSRPIHGFLKARGSAMTHSASDVANWRF